MLYGYSNLFLNFCQPLNGDYSKFFWSFSMRCIFALRFVLFMHKINSGCQSVFVVELATREDSHKNNEKQPVTLSAAFWRFQATIAFPTLFKSLYGLPVHPDGIRARLWHLSHTNTKNLHTEDWTAVRSDGCRWLDMLAWWTGTVARWTVNFSRSTFENEHDYGQQDVGGVNCR